MDRKVRAKGVQIGKAMLTMLAVVAELDRENMRARQMAGIERAKAEGKSLGRPSKINPALVKAWRIEHRRNREPLRHQHHLGEAGLRLLKPFLSSVGAMRQIRQQTVLVRSAKCWSIAGLEVVVQTPTIGAGNAGADRPARRSVMTALR
ncbi:recombinase family protein [Halochromatium salexigens]|uniref:recombinase family protein n=1 Tax=Halochromatium salexigens TaxID=49447 RepID=UPI0019135B72